MTTDVAVADKALDPAHGQLVLPAIDGTNDLSHRLLLGFGLYEYSRTVFFYYDICGHLCFLHVSNVNVDVPSVNTILRDATQKGRPAPRLPAIVTTS